ncbi:hypothetical protein ccbrp13_39700 [Ktedonobacteria bacterium brp13]|nr:hypothetical protein ccbrp13_39700 [Ktedonobacteria bacterium brp13]
MMEKVVPGALQRLKAADIIRIAGLATASLGQEYNRTASIENTQRQGARLRAIVSVPETRDPLSPESNAGDGDGEHNEILPTLEDAASAHAAHIYPVEVEIISATNWNATCPCSAGRSPRSTICAHAASVLYRWLAQPASFEVLPIPLPPEKAVPTRNQKKHSTPPAQENAGLNTTANNNPVVVRYSEDLVGILQQLGLSELRNIAREYNLVHNGASKQQIAEMIVESVKQPESVRRVASTLEKEQRQLLAALVLAGGALNDDDLRGLFERFSLGQPAQLQRALLGLQSKALLFRTNSLSDEGYSRSNLGGNWLDIGWFVPTEVRGALRVSVPISVFDIEHPGEKHGNVQVLRSEPYRILSDLLLIARSLIGYRLDVNEHWLPATAARPDSSVTALSAAASAVPPTFVPSPQPTTTAFPASLTLRSEPNVPLPVPDEIPSEAVLQWISAKVPRSPAYLRGALHILTLSGMLYRDERDPSVLRVLPDVAQILLGSAPDAVLADLFQLWLRHISYGELYELSLEGLHIHARTTALNVPVVRQGEIEEENREARLALLALFALTPAGPWINFQGFVRFVYRLTPHFLQQRQRLYSSPHWWFEREPGRALKPLNFADWQRAELLYIRNLLVGPLTWWGLCDCVYSAQGQLIAFRLTDIAARLLHRESNSLARATTASQAEPADPLLLRCLAPDEVVLPCARSAWSALTVLEACAEPAGINGADLVYHLIPGAFAAALSRGDQRARELLTLLHAAADNEEVADGPLHTLALQVEQWLANYGRVRIYTGVTLLEVADTTVLREVNAHTNLEDQVVQQLQPTIHLLKKSAVRRLVDDVKRHGLSPLVHDEDSYGAE